MRITTNHLSNRIGGCLLATVTVLGLTAASADDDHTQPATNNPGVYPPHSKPYGVSYGDWSAMWWQWLLRIPPETNPNLEGTPLDPNPQTVNDCAQGQSGPVWFLAGTFGGPAERTCTVPTGWSLLLPLPNYIAGAGVGDCPRDGPCDVVALRAAAAAYIDGIDIQTFNVSLDGVLVRDLIAYRAKSPVFSYVLPTDNNILAYFGFPDPHGTYKPAVSDGYWLMFTPLRPGKHTIISGNLTIKLSVERERNKD